MAHRLTAARTCVACAALLLSIGASAGTQSSGAVSARFVGHWRLMEVVRFDEAGTPTPDPYDGGRIMYDAAGNMSAQLMRPGRRSPAGSPGEQELAALYRTYVAYFGRYTIDEAAGTVTHHVAGALNQAWVGTPLVRWYRFSDDGRRLMLSVKTDGRVTTTLTWERLP